MLWDATTGQKLRTFEGHARALSADGQRVLTDGQDITAMLWDVTTGQNLRTFEGFPCARAPTVRQVLTGGLVLTADLWDATTGQKLRTFEGLPCALSADARQTVTTSQDGTARLWDVATGQELLRLISFSSGKDWLVVTPEGLFDGSPGGRERVTFRVGGGVNIVPGDRFLKDFYRPGLFAAISRGERPLPPPPKPALPEKEELTVDLGNGVKLTMVPIFAGSFIMGSPELDKDAANEERPQHPVRITKPFYMGKYLVTQEQWEAVMHNNPSKFRGPKNPVDSVSRDDCQHFLEKLREIIPRVGLAPPFSGEGFVFCLPTEAQWEYACRAGSMTRFSFGHDESELGDYAWYRLNSNSTHPVGERKPNAWGLYDMHGNVWEWCQDLFDGGYYSRSPQDDPAPPPAPPAALPAAAPAVPAPPAPLPARKSTRNGAGGRSPQDDPTGPATDAEYMLCYAELPTNSPTEPVTNGGYVLRGGSWSYDARHCRSAYRAHAAPGERSADVGFRVALVVESPPPTSPAPAIPPPPPMPPLAKAPSGASTASSAAAPAEPIVRPKPVPLDLKADAKAWSLKPGSPLNPASVGWKNDPEKIRLSTLSGGRPAGVSPRSSPGTTQKSHQRNSQWTSATTSS